MVPRANSPGGRCLPRLMICSEMLHHGASSAAAEADGQSPSLPYGESPSKEKFLVRFNTNAPLMVRESRDR